MLHVNANHSDVVSGFPASFKAALAGRNTLAFTKGATAPKEDDRENMQPNLGVQLNRKVCMQEG